MTSQVNANGGDQVGRFWRWANLIFGLALFLLVLFAPSPTGLSPQAQRLAAITVLMGAYWITEPIPIAVTSLLPIALYPLFDILPGKSVTRAYADPTVYLFLGGFLLAMGIERWNLHRRIALHVLKFVGSSPRRIVFGFMFSTGALSLWISNSATALMMLPIGLALIITLRDSIAKLNPEGADAAIAPITIPVLLSIAYASSIAGIGTYISTPPNMVFRGFWNQQFVSQGAPEVSFATWMIVFIPMAFVMLLLSGIVMTWGMKPIPNAEGLTKEFFKEQLQGMGKITPAEIKVAGLFFTAGLLWVLRTPFEFGSLFTIPDWPSLLVRAGTVAGLDLQYLQKHVEDSTIAIFLACFLFVLPGDGPKGDRPRLLTWKEAERGMPWGMLLLFGGGFAMADAFVSTKLSGFVGDHFARILEGQSPFIMIVMVCTLVTILTEFTSNTATANMLLPILAAVAVQLNMDPRLLLIPATISSSYGFMMPVGTPPNAIVFATGRVPIRSMLAYGFVLNVLGVIVVSLWIWFVGAPVMQIPIPK